MNEAKSNIQGEILRQAQVGNTPEILLVELGFNDLAWGVNNPDGLISDVKTFIDQARLAKSNIKILIANVVNRTPLPNNPNLMPSIASYNSKLPAAIDSKDTDKSPVLLVDLNSTYSPSSDAYDGLHPNGVGEYKMARAFANSLSSRLGVGGSFGTIPASVPALQPTAPSSITATPTDAGITVSWPHVFGAGGYWLWTRNVTALGDWTMLPLPIPADSWRVGGTVRGTQYEYKVQTTRGDWVSGFSATAPVTANPKTPDPPATNTITVTPGSGYIDLSWVKPGGPYANTITGYKVYVVDNSVNPATLVQVNTSGLSVRVPGLINGHSYGLAVAAIGTYGEGPLGAAPTAIPGGGTPGATTLTSVAGVPNSCCDVTLSWTQAPGSVAGYWIWTDDLTDAQPRATLPYTVPGLTQGVGWLFSGAANYSFCVQAANGSLRGPISNCRRVDGVSGKVSTSAPLARAAVSPLIKGGSTIDPILDAAIQAAPIAEYLKRNPEASGHDSAIARAKALEAATAAGMNPSAARNLQIAPLAR